MKVIFLDIDGVLNSDRFYEEIFRNKPENHPLVMTDIDGNCVKYLNKVTDDTGAVIVVTSSWRKDGLHNIASRLSDAGVKGQVVGVTRFWVEPDTVARMLKPSLDQKWDGKKVVKSSGKPFKYGGKVGTVNEVCLSHPYKPDVMGFIIKEDGSFVEAWRCMDMETAEQGPKYIRELSFVDRAERGIQVNDWLETNKDHVLNYVIIDDEGDFLACQRNNLVKVDRRVGFTENDSKKAIEILNRNGI